MNNTPQDTDKSEIAMVVGIMLGFGVLTLILTYLTGDASIWSYMIPIGVSTALAITAGWRARKRERDQR